MCDSLEVGGSGEADIIPEAHIEEPFKRLFFFTFLCFFLFPFVNIHHALNFLLPDLSSCQCPSDFNKFQHNPSYQSSLRPFQPPPHFLMVSTTRPCPGVPAQRTTWLTPHDVPCLHNYQSGAEEQDNFWLLQYLGVAQYSNCSVVCSDVLWRQRYTIRAASELTHQSLCLPVLVCSLSVSWFDRVFLRQPWLSLCLHTRRWMNLAGPSLCLCFSLLFLAWVFLVPPFVLINLIIIL